MITILGMSGPKSAREGIERPSQNRADHQSHEEIIPVQEPSAATTWLNIQSPLASKAESTGADKDHGRRQRKPSCRDRPHSCARAPRFRETNCCGVDVVTDHFFTHGSPVERTLHKENRRRRPFVRRRPREVSSRLVGAQTALWASGGSLCHAKAMTKLTTHEDGMPIWVDVRSKPPNSTTTCAPFSVHSLTGRGTSVALRWVTTHRLTRRIIGVRSRSE